MPTIRLYHGTAKSFTAFDPHFTLRGSEPNSALGIHLTEDPNVAADYAELAMRDAGAERPRVLIVDAEVRQVAIVSSREDFLGRGHEDDFETTRTASQFVEARLELIDQGFDALAGDELGDDLIGVWVIFDPLRLTIAGEMSLDSAREREPSETPDYASEPVSLFGEVGSEENFEAAFAG